MKAIDVTAVPGAATLTLLFTDIEGSTRLVQQSREEFARALSEHNELLTAIFQSTGGRIVDTQGDSFFVAYPQAGQAVSAAVAAMKAIERHAWPPEARVRVRMGLHTGEPVPSGDRLVGVDVNVASRIASSAHGGQVLLSATTAALVERTFSEPTVSERTLSERTRPERPSAERSVADSNREIPISLRMLGEYRLKDLREAVRIFQLDVAGLQTEFPPLRNIPASFGVRTHGLPVTSTSFVGRAEALDRIGQLFGATRLLTLTGPGGTGKTRIAVETAHEAVDTARYPDGVWFADLAPISDPHQVAPLVASLFNLREESGRPVLERIADALSGRNLLLILDNCEHLIDACVELTAALLRRCPEVRLLVTGREALGIEGEQVWRVPPLAFPQDGSTTLELGAESTRELSAASIAEYEAPRLFVERARAVRADFELTNGNAAAVAEICRRLDGIPLAIELAASRLRHFSVAEIAKRLDDRFRLLTGGSRSALHRQQTLRSLIDWSYDLLDFDEQVLLKRLSVFAGGWSYDAAQAIGGAADILTPLSGLVDKSLVVVDERAEGSRYHLLETIRQYSRDRLLESGESEQIRDAHLHYFLLLAEEADRSLRGAGQRRWLLRLDEDYYNLRAALEWAGFGDRIEPQIRLTSALWRYWRVRGNFAEGRRRLDSALVRAERAPSHLRARILMRAGSLAGYQADYGTADRYMNEALQLYRELGDESGIGNSLNILSSSTMMRGDFSAARRMLDESKGISLRRNDARGVAYARFFLGTLAIYETDYATAIAELDAALPALESLGDEWWVANTRLQIAWAQSRAGAGQGSIETLGMILRDMRGFEDRGGAARTLFYLGDAHVTVGNLSDAPGYLRESLSLCREIGDAWWIICCLEAIAVTAALTGDTARAARLAGACEQMHDTLQIPLLPAFQDRVERTRELVVSSRSAAEHDALRQAGRRLTLEQAVMEALEK